MSGALPPPRLHGAVGTRGSQAYQESAYTRVTFSTQIPRRPRNRPSGGFTPPSIPGQNLYAARLEEAAKFVSTRDCQSAPTSTPAWPTRGADVHTDLVRSQLGTAQRKHRGAGAVESGQTVQRSPCMDGENT